MNRSLRHASIRLTLGLGLLCQAAVACAADPAAEERAIRAAAMRAAPSVVRIETVGGLERVGELLVGTGPTTGVVLTADGYIVSSSFNFVQQPASILVTLPDGTRLPAQRVANDRSRQLTLLKVDAPSPLVIPEIVPEEETSVGAWAIALGRTYAADEPNISVGIVSALARLGGRVIQTDAKISPANYGGPLIDIRGRVLGVLVPLSPQGGDEIAGVEWYDSGIGFAVPLAHVMRMLPRWQAGTDLRPGILGITLKEKGPLAEPVTIDTCRPNSPAAKAGLLPGDRVVEVAGVAVTRQGELYRQLQPLYAGDRTSIVVERGNARESFEVELVGELEPYEHPYLGLLPSRGERAAGAPAGVEVRSVLPDSPAAAVGLAVGDVVTEVAGSAIADRTQLTAALARYQPGDTVKLTVQRGDQIVVLEPQLGPQPGELDYEVPAAPSPAEAANGAPEAEHPALGRQTLKLPELPQEAIAYVPETYQSGMRYGLVFWFDGAEPVDRDELLRAWQPLCDARGLILVAPSPATPGRWTLPDVEFARGVYAELEQRYAVDRARTVAMGQQTGGTAAYVFALRNRELFAGVVAIDTVLAQKPPENEPAYRLDVLAFVPEQSAQAGRIQESLEAIGQMNYRVNVLSQSGTAHLPTGEDLQAVARWLELLDRI
ncbi:MAG: PDZ domain-containing protein [Pirellulales bacterium]|nr:PDZ domain-containing protein [Pirellulales bacterium]